ncbi:MAG TPA: PQQ-binding-like beta-propeller repeat protein [Prolixibacteraceae bacterium]|nr:PQQ-binding-like beta-propeller repeat protein [Prolixibacteraceae bacterium]
MKKIFTLLLIAAATFHVGNTVNAAVRDSKEQLPDWSFQTKNLIYSTVFIDDTLIYAGGFDSTFYALNLNGVEQWHFKTNFPIKCQAVTVDSIVCFSCGNALYGLNKTTGLLYWKHQPAEIASLTPTLQLDPWDMKDASPIVSNGIIYYGNEYGTLFGVKATDGSEKFSYQTEIKAPIRTKPAIANDVIFFGDHEGYVFAVNIPDGKLVWSMRTNHGEKPYAQFGGIFGDMVVDNGRLYFGIRNSLFQVLDIATGKIIWKYESGGTWLSGTPVIEGNNVFVGTSDTHEFCAFDRENGNLKWKKSVSYGVYNAPLMVGDKLCILAGDEQHPADAHGAGKIVLLDQDGNIENAVRLSGSVFNTPTLKDGKIYFTSTGGSINCLSLDKITQNARASLMMDQSQLDLGTIDKISSVYKSIGYIKNEGTLADSIMVSIESSELLSTAIKPNPASYFLSGNDSVLLRVLIFPKELTNGSYKFTFKVASTKSKDTTFEKEILFTRNIATGTRSFSDQTTNPRIYPNPCNNWVTLETNVQPAGEISFDIIDLQGKFVSQTTLPKGEKSIGFSTENLERKIYLIRIYNDGLPVSETHFLKK